MVFVLKAFDELCFELADNKLHTNMSDDHVISVVVCLQSNIRTHCIKLISYSDRHNLINQIRNTLNLGVQKDCSQHLKSINNLATFILSLEVQFIVNSSFCNGILFQQHIQNRVQNSSQISCRTSKPRFRS